MNKILKNYIIIKITILKRKKYPLVELRSSKINTFLSSFWILECVLLIWLSEANAMVLLIFLPKVTTGVTVKFNDFLQFFSVPSITNTSMRFSFSDTFSIRNWLDPISMIIFSFKITSGIFIKVPVVLPLSFKKKQLSLNRISAWCRLMLSSKITISLEECLPIFPPFESKR